ncbi:unnamed protein product [Linum tenue]|uniref:Uncharacterized protein n=1 Tax=Linum tenue TaxID=586396 RepID=A0AAV0QPE5_9ROSI|nr:unnamed protein product [Linum tenue]
MVTKICSKSDFHALILVSGAFAKHEVRSIFAKLMAAVSYSPSVDFIQRHQKVEKKKREWVGGTEVVQGKEEEEATVGEVASRGNLICDLGIC